MGFEVADGEGVGAEGWETDGGDDFVGRELARVFGFRVIGLHEFRGYFFRWVVLLGVHLVHFHDVVRCGGIEMFLG